MTTAKDMFVIWVAISSIAGLTWFFSTRPRLFIRIFVPKDEWRGAIRAFVHAPRHSQGMRLMAMFQFALACIFGGIGAWLWFVS